MIYYIGDLHLMHENCLTFDNRPFSSVEEMNKTLIRNWNSVVDKKDTVYVVGDVCMKVTPEVLDTLSQLNGIKCLAIGNHDHRLVKYLLELDPAERAMYFNQIQESYCIKDKGRQVFISHLPHAAWPNMERGSYHVYAHLHKSFGNIAGMFMLTQLHAFNSGCMLHNYTPVTLDQMRESMMAYRSFMFDESNSFVQ